MERSEDWLFFIKLSPKLKADFVQMSLEFQSHNTTLIPISIEHLLECSKKIRRVNIVISIKSLDEYEFFHRRAKKLLKFLVQGGRANIFLISSFTQANNQCLMRKGFYHFLKLPQTHSDIASKITSLAESNKSSKDLWPGTNRGPDRGIVI